NLAGTLEVDIIGTEWQIPAVAKGRFIATGEVVDQGATSVTLRWTGRAPYGVPSVGTLDPHLGPSQVAFQRQGDAISALESGTAVSERLREILEDPQNAAPPRTVPEPNWELELDSDKRQAIIGALGVPEVAVLKGPP